ncbi:MAG: hypothetical protein IPJ45_07525 [Ignavibacteria bacterium]|nr:hypothetical protein [Ignavibacteria bacterium]
MAAGDSSLNGLIYKTTNGGNNWISQEYIGTYINDIIYLIYNDFSTNHSVYKTTNGGANWVSSYYHQHASFILSV